MAISVTASLKLRIEEFQKGLAKATQNLNNFAEKATNSANTTMNFSKKLTESYAEATKELNKHKLGLKDVARIVQGITVSKIFYSAWHSISNATSAVWEFNKSLDYAKITYSALFGSTELAKDFMSVLKEFSVRDTIFDYRSLTNASKALSAYGIQSENLLYILRGITNLTTLTGDAQALDRIAYAMGQIYAKGKLSAEEMRQLTNAYVPIQQILKEQMGLSEAQIADISKQDISGAATINAIVEYANREFGDMANAAMLTIEGLESRIKDAATMSMSALMQPLTTIYKSFLVYLYEGIDGIRAAIDAAGTKGLFEHLVPDPQVQAVIRAFFANLQNLFMTIMSIGVVVIDVVRNMAHVFVTAFNIIAPPIMLIVNALTMMLHAVLNTRVGIAALRIAAVAAAAAFIILRVHAMGVMVVTAVTKAVYGLGQALLILSRIITSPAVAILLVLVTALVGVAAVSGRANQALSTLFSTISKAVGGRGYADVFTDTSAAMDDASDAASKFDNALEGIGDTAEDAADKAGDAADKAGKKAKKAAKDLLSFDEVFRLPEKAEAAAASKKDALGTDNILSDLEALADGFKGLGENLIPEIPDFRDFISGFTDGLFGGLNTAFDGRLKDGLLGATLGAGIGAILGGLVGHPQIGAGIGALVGGIAGLLWPELEKALANSDGTAVFQLSAATTIGGVLGSLLGGVPGALIGTAIGAFAGELTAIMWDKLASNMSDPNAAANANTGVAIGSIVGAVIGGLLGGAPGALIGAAIGDFAGGFVGLFWSNITDAFSNNFSPIADAFAKIWDNIQTAWEEHDWLSLGGNVVFGVLAGISTGIAAIPMTIASFFQGIWDGICEAFGIASPAKEMEPLGDFILKGILEGMLSVISNIGEWIDEHLFEPIRTAVGEFDILGAIGAAGENVKITATVALEKAANWAADAWEAVKTGGGTVKRVLQQGVEKGVTWVADAWSAVKEKAANISRSLKQSVEKGSWVSDAWSAVKTAAGTVSRTLSQNVSKGGTWVSDAWTAAKKTAGTVTRTLAQNVKKGSTWVADAWAAAKLVAGTIYRTLVQSVTGKKSGKADGGVLSGNSWKPITAYASGGAPNTGEFFLARERGPELVGRLGSHTAVMNNDQIVASVSAGVYTAVASAMSGLNAMNASILNIIVDASNAITGAIGKAGSIGYSAAQAGVASRDMYTGRPGADQQILREDFMSFANIIVDALRNQNQTQAAFATPGGQQQTESLPPVYVGTLIADDRGLRDLERRLRIIRVNEGRRGV